MIKNIVNLYITVIFLMISNIYKKNKMSFIIYKMSAILTWSKFRMSVIFVLTNSKNNIRYALI